MPSAKLTMLKRINELRHRSAVGKFRFTFPVLGLMLTAGAVQAQDNSPYSRFGLGDLVPNTNVNMRAMGGVSAGYKDILSINYSNPATFGSFQTFRVPGAKKISNGRAILDIGINMESRTLKDPLTSETFTASNALFSHVMIGVPLKPNWGLSFGLRPMTRVSYKQIDLFKSSIDSTQIQSQGDGGTYLASLGTGWRFRLSNAQSLSVGVGSGYLFGRTDYSRRVSILNDSLAFTSGNYQTRTSYGALYANAGLQYDIRLDTAKQLFLTLGAYGNLKRDLGGSRDNITETYFFNPDAGNTRIDSVRVTSGVNGDVTYPASYTVGFLLEKRFSSAKAGTWMFGVDLVQSKWSEYRNFGQTDPNVQDKWEVRAGGEVKGPYSRNYFGNVAYRAGFFVGRDYLKIVGRQLPLWGASLGFGLPIIPRSSQAANQATMLNLSFEYSKRGNNNNPLSENMFRVSAGFSLSDIWFNKRKYE